MKSHQYVHAMINISDKRLIVNRRTVDLWKRDKWQFKRIWRPQRQTHTHTHDVNRLKSNNVMFWLVKIQLLILFLVRFMSVGWLLFRLFLVISRWNLYNQWKQQKKFIYEFLYPLFRKNLHKICMISCISSIETRLLNKKFSVLKSDKHFLDYLYFHLHLHSMPCVSFQWDTHHFINVMGFLFYLHFSELI